MKLELRPDGKALLTNFPQGRSVSEGGLYCVTSVEDERYSGEATWEARNGYSLFLRFDESEILVSSGTQKFGGQDWTVVQFTACESEQWWELGYVCGDSGYGRDDREPPVFRDECPVRG